jgi:hypothetical protein
MKRELKQVLWASKIAVTLLWPVSAWAATLTFGAQMATIPMLDVLMTLVLSILSGTTSLLHAMKQEYERNGAIPRIGLFVASKMFGSILAGLLMFFCAEAWDWPENYQAAAIIVAAFGGTIFVEGVFKAAMKRNLPESQA